MYILVSCCEGNFIINKYNTYNDAYARMDEEYNEFIVDCEEQDWHSIEGYGAFVAYELGSRCDWHIEEM